MVRLSRVNSALLALIIIINAYIIVAPFAPNVWFWWQSRHSQQTASLGQKIHQQSPPKNQPNSVIIPSMLLDQPILEGRDTYAILNKGIWHWPASSTPDKGGNTVLLGHRFTYTNPRGVFYFLNKVKVGDEIGITWHNTNYHYKVSDVKVVSPTDTNILNPTDKPTLTLYTCTPLWWPKDRLVVTAQLENDL
jgi:sortase A